MNTILVLGATGLLGEPVARRLKEDGFNVRILARDAEKAQSVFGDGFEIAEGDATRREDIDRVLAGCDGVHLTLSGEAERIGAERVAEAAQTCGIERITYISGCTAVEQNRWFPMVADKLRAEQAVRESGVSYTIFAPTWPMEMLARYVRDGKPMVIGRMEGPFHFFALEDLARMVSASYRMEEAVNKRLVIHGPEGYSFSDALLRYCAVFHPDVTRVSHMPVWLVKLMAVAMRNDLMKLGADLGGYFDRVGELGDPTEANELLGAPALTLDEWLARRKAAMRKAALVER
jgi:uncharacterized protein YbjT (DUF2867 family)